MDYLSREIRSAKINTGSVGEIDTFKILQIVNANNEIVTYRFENNNFLRNGEKLNSVKVTDKSHFVVDKRGPAEKEGQPRITIVLELEENGQKINLQTTISSRAY
jgi:hypothetical protein